MSSPPRKRRLFPRSLSECVDPLTKPVFAQAGIAETKLIRHWEQIVGTELARHAMPHQMTYPKGKNEGATLVIHARSGFATEIQHMEPVIVERIASYFGYRAVTKLAIRQVHAGAFKDKPTRPAPRKAVAPPPVAVEDPELRGALERLGMAMAAMENSDKK